MHAPPHIVFLHYLLPPLSHGRRPCQAHPQGLVQCLLGGLRQASVPVWGNAAQRSRYYCTMSRLPRDGFTTFHTQGLQSQPDDLQMA